MPAQSLQAPDAKDTRQQLERILSNKTFRESRAPARLLRFTVEETLAGRTAEIKEYTLGSLVLGRGNRFDPKLDTIVRVQFRRLRAKLQHYYATDGKSDRIVIVYEKGRYVPDIRVRPVDPAPQPTPASVAVLPFADSSNTPEEAYFGEGIADELITGLSRIPALKVVARTSAFQFRGSGVDVREIGARLGVQTVMEGSIRRSADQLRLSVRLVNAADGFAIWSSVYERKTQDVFALQDELVHAITSTLAPRLGADGGAIGRPRPSIATEVYHLYLRGRHQWNQLGPESLNRAIECFREVIARAPSYAPAHAGLADCYIALAYSGYASPAEVMPKAREAAIEATVLDPDLAAAHTSLAKVAEDFEWRVREAESIYLKAIALNPGYSTAHYWYGMHLFASSRQIEAFREIRQSQEIDPLSPMINWAAGMMLEIQGRNPEAQAQYRRAHELIPQNVDTLRYLLLGAARKGRYSDVERAQLHRQLPRDDVVAQIVFAGIHGTHGRIAEGIRILEGLERRVRSLYVPPIQVSTAYLVLGQFERALAWLEEAFVQRDSQLLWIASDPLFQPLRHNPRFQTLLERIAAARE